MTRRFEDKEIEFLIAIFERFVMATIESQVTDLLAGQKALQTSVDALTAAITTLTTTGVKVDNTAVLAAIAAVQAGVTDIAAQVDQIPTTPTP